MTKKVSVSRTGQNQPPPSRQERDAAASSDAGRKAVEEPIDEVIQQHQRCKRSEAEQARKTDATLAEPIGLQLETIADAYLEGN
jgi:hypothetical protein